MSKLTEIKEGIEIAKKNGLLLVPIKINDLNDLLSLLEEKDKALNEIITTYDEGEEYFPTVRKMVRIARKALNTSSNNEGEEK